MPGAVDTVLCGHCGELIDESLDVPGQRRPCSACFSTARTFSVVLAESVSARDGYCFKHRRPGFGRPLAEGYRRPETNYQLGNLVERQLLVDRQNDRYLELVTDYESGAVIHRCDEKLSEHRGHGAARPKAGDG